MPEHHPGLSASLRLEALGCVRGGRALFTGLELALGAGEAALVTGPNGAGKTSLLRVIAGLLRPQAGSVNAEGRIAFAGEQAALDPERPLAKALRYWARLDGLGEADVLRALDAMKLAHLAEIPVRMLSTGQRKRAALARAVAGGADIWLLDEPANGLDAEARAGLELAIEAHRALGGIAVIATHLPLELPGAQSLVLGEAT